MQYNLFKVYQVYILAALIALYLIPIISLPVYSLKKHIQYSSVHAFFGRIEWFFSIYRDLFIPPFLIIYAVYLFFDSGLTVYPFLYILFAGLSIWNYFHRRGRIRILMEFIIGDFLLEPVEFFRYYFSAVSGLPGHLPERPSKVVTLPIDCRDKKSRVIFRPFIPGLITTGILARLVVRASKWKGSVFSGKVAESAAAIWGARVVQLTRSRLDVEGMEFLTNVKGRAIFVANHKSFIDFTLIPLIIRLANLKREKPFKCRFMAAREHFRDNIFLYHIIGMGKALEKIGTVFVDRSSKLKRATDAVSEAAGKMVEDGVDIALYPQGTRAYGNKTSDGRRMDAGYYTTGSPDKLINERGHMKKGAAYLAVDVAIMQAKSGSSLSVVPIGLEATGTVVPRGKVRVQTGVNMKVSFGHPITLSSDNLGELMKVKRGTPEYNEMRGLLVESVFEKMDESLKAVLRIHERLNKRLLIDIREMMRDDMIDKFLEALKAWRDDEDLIFSTIDCIYSLPARLWSSHLNRLAQLIVETDTSRDKILEFKKIVVEEMVKFR